MDEQRRAAAGGEVGANGEWYRGGAFIATTDHPKSAPLQAERPDPAWVADQRERAAKIREWVCARRARFAELIDRLTVNPGDVSDDRWQWMLENGHAGFLPSLGRDLSICGSLSRRQAEFVARFVFGRRSAKNDAAWSELVDSLSQQCE